MIFARLINGVLTLAPRFLEIDGAVVYNPTAEQYLSQGWKPLEDGDPLPDKEFYTVRQTFTETAEAIQTAF